MYSIQTMSVCRLCIVSKLCLCADYVQYADCVQTICRLPLPVFPGVVIPRFCLSGLSTKLSHPFLFQECDLISLLFVYLYLFVKLSKGPVKKVWTPRDGGDFSRRSKIFVTPQNFQKNFVTPQNWSKIFHDPITKHFYQSFCRQL